MSKTYIPVALRQLVVSRANALCEYCLIHEQDTYFGCEVDHIISEKHGGPTNAKNLAYACLYCNRNKGSDVGSIIWETGKFYRFYNPREDAWSTHFVIDGARIVPQTNIGHVTARILELNRIDRLIEREEMRKHGLYPSVEAQKLINL
ncbi:MAG: HNH endonuclease, partial [Sphaerospermopsis sp. SIO1G2]|nr:HNH endonuclease [Sphaerospermopsis sp. SIO1G2]